MSIRIGPYKPPIVRPPRTLNTKFGLLLDPGYESRRPGDPWVGHQMADFLWDQRNATEMLNGRPPWGADHEKVVLHHRAQQPNGPLDEYTARRHREQTALMHGEDYTRIDRALFDEQRARYWVWRALRHLGALPK